MEKKIPFETLESRKRKIGRFTIVQDCVRVNGKFIYRKVISQTKKGRLLVEIHKLI